MAVELGIAEKEYLLEVAGKEPRVGVYIAFGVYGTPIQARFASKCDVVVVITRNEKNPMIPYGHHIFVTDPTLLLDQLLK